MCFDRDVIINIVPAKNYNDIYDIANIFYSGLIRRAGAPAVKGAGGGEQACDAIDVELSGGRCAINASFANPDGSRDTAGDATGDPVCGDPVGGDAIGDPVGGEGCVVGDTDVEACRDATGNAAGDATGDPVCGDPVGDDAIGVSIFNIKMRLYRLLKTRAAFERGGGEVPLPWGALVGIRPVKLYAGLLGRGLTEREAAAYMECKYDVRQQTSELCMQIAAAQSRIISSINPETDYMLYIGVPFCKSKCAYCSFPSDAHNKAETYSAPYLDAIIKELNVCADRVKSAGRRLRAVYIGGGTPTALGARELSRLLDGALCAFSGETPDELTVEAGRADTIDSEKLRIIRGVAGYARRIRLCVNPQTMNPATLRLIGRGHTPDDVVNAFSLAREHGFDDINMDIIAGLPGEGAPEFANTLGAVFALKPESVTVHTLCVKRSSRLNEFPAMYSCPDAATTANMLAAASQYAGRMGMSPYYLYRQKNTIGNLSNIGYALNGCECVYNIVEMSDCADVIAVGAGAVSKFTDAASGLIERVFNVKNLLEYINRVDEMIDRKLPYLAFGRKETAT